VALLGPAQGVHSALTWAPCTAFNGFNAVSTRDILVVGLGPREGVSPQPQCSTEKPTDRKGKRIRGWRKGSASPFEEPRCVFCGRPVSESTHESLDTTAFTRPGERPAKGASATRLTHCWHRHGDSRDRDNSPRREVSQPKGSTRKCAVKRTTRR
jgi:hypothetical protein